MKKSVFLALTILIGPRLQAEIQDHAALHYTFNTEEENGVSGVGDLAITGTVYGATWVTNGLEGGAYSFDAINDFIEVGPYFELSTNLPAITVCAWIKAPASFANEMVSRTIVSRRTNLGDYSGWDLRGMGRSDMGEPPGHIGADMVSSWPQRTYAKQSSTFVFDDHWHFVCGVYTYASNRMTTSVFIDGVMESSHAYTAGETNTLAEMNVPTPLVIGSSDGQNFFGGLIDEVMIFSNALSNTEISQLYSSYSPANDYLILHYGFETSSGSVVHDQSEYGHDGLLQDASIVAGGYDGLCGSFTNMTSLIEVTNNPEALAFNYDSSFTLMAYVKQTGLQPTTGGANIIRKDSGSGGFWLFDMNVANGAGGFAEGLLRFQCGTRFDSMPEISCTIPEYERNKWIHVSAIRDHAQGLLQLYVDGLLVTQKVDTTTAVWFDTPGQILIGSFPIFNSSLLGEIDELKVFDRALTEDEVLNEFREVDTDDDGLPDAWEQEYFEDPLIANPGDDPDEDGFTNYQEFLIGTNPHEFDNLCTVNFAVEISWPSVAGVRYQVQYQEPGSGGGWVDLGDPVTGNGGIMKAYNPTLQRNHWYRVNVISD